MRWIVSLVMLLAACGTTDSKHNRKPDVQARYDRAVKAGQLVLGMSESEVLASVGKPIRKKKVTVHRRPRVEWVYSSYSLYFDGDGFLVKWNY